ncbi:hypothetical protein WMY93_024327 [Mugilogobius chulae]|uniref:E3 ubiquitin ligase TRAF3IP2 n=1 Tax=Mugilogobius chulae TaxID=88201 RepID=A0AAW0N3T5_9GOBI
MLPTSVCSSHVFSHVSSLDRYLTRYSNTPEEDDETMSTHHQPADPPTLYSDYQGSESSPVLLRRRPDRDPRHVGMIQHSHFSPYAPVHGGPTPFHSQADESWSHGATSCCCHSGPPHHQHHSSLPSQLSLKEYSSCSEDSSGMSSCHKSLSSIPSVHSSVMGSLEQPLSLRSLPPSSEFRHHTLSPYSCAPQEAPCCAQCPPEQFNRGPTVNKPVWPQYQYPGGARPIYPGDFRLPAPAYTHIGNNVLAKEKMSSMSSPLSLEQRRVFVTYEADSDKHVNEVISFVALLRHNGFDTHIDIFEQQFRSISKIDFMERYLSEKEYLIIIIISPKYYSTVTATPTDHEQDERTFNTVYIHKQLQNEFIQNGSKNFRFIPILFPGAKRCHVPAWLQNTNVYSWPRDRDDILRRLMRVEKYNLLPSETCPPSSPSPYKPSAH